MYSKITSVVLVVSTPCFNKMNMASVLQSNTAVCSAENPSCIYTGR